MKMPADPGNIDPGFFLEILVLASKRSGSLIFGKRFAMVSSLKMTDLWWAQMKRPVFKRGLDVLSLIQLNPH